jgi:ABC-type uncharacterized transport system substrate-binding protein
VRRRKFITLLGGAAAWPLTARAQQAAARRIGVLMGYAEIDQEGQAFVTAFREALQKPGWTEGRNIRIDTRWAAGDTEAIQRLAKELVALQPELILSATTPNTAALLQQTRTIPIIFVNVADPIVVQRDVTVIVASGGDQAVRAAQAATRTIPIVATIGSDPVETGFVHSLNRPDGNITGVSVFAVQLVAKTAGVGARVYPARVSHRFLGESEQCKLPNLHT